jgi:hypothetical protein
VFRAEFALDSRPMAQVVPHCGTLRARRSSALIPWLLAGPDTTL